MAPPSMTLKHEGRLTAVAIRGGQGGIESRTVTLVAGSC